MIAPVRPELFSQLKIDPSVEVLALLVEIRNVILRASD